MYDEIYFINNAGERFDYNLDQDPNGWLPLSEITFDIDARADDRQKMQRHGIWGNSTLAGALIIHFEGNLIANTAELVNAYKLEMMRIHMPPFGGGRYANQVGQLYLKFSGASETYYAKVGYEAFPRAVSRAFHPAILPFSVTFKAFDGYMLGVSTGNPYWVT